MTFAHATSVALLAAGVIAGTIADRPVRREPLTLGGYRVLSVDFHAHSSLWSNGMLTPWGLALEAERQGLDALAITAHNEVWDAESARAFSSWIGGPTILVGQEVHNVDHHLIAVGIQHVVDFRKPLIEQIEDVHRQGGVAIAAHPIRSFYPGFDRRSTQALDGAEICHPTIYYDPSARRELERFAARAPMAPIGSSDFHGWGRLGDCRTYVFATDTSADAIVDAIRAHRTVVYSTNGKAYGSPELVALADTRPELRKATEPARVSALDWMSRAFGFIGLAGVLLTDRIRSRARTDRDRAHP